MTRFSKKLRHSEIYSVKSEGIFLILSHQKTTSLSELPESKKRSPWLYDDAQPKY